MQWCTDLWPQNLILMLIISDLSALSDGVSWLYVASAGVGIVNHKHQCRRIRGLTRRQIQICRRNVQHMESVQIGATMAINECQYQFSDRRWNCSQVDDQDEDNIFGSMLRLGTRETAFLNAIAAAGVAHTVTRDCSSGKLAKCGCDLSLRGPSGRDFHWSGCSDNINYGCLFSKRFVDAHERRKHLSYARYLMNLHNNEAGRKVIEKNMRLHCKCHGVSGSCELKTCWNKMPTFREVGRDLKDRFDGATEVTLIKQNSRRILMPAYQYFKQQTDQDLVYIAQSPDFCEYDNVTGTLGTHGRECNKTSRAIGGCELLCCGRGYQTRVERRVERCDCKFHWCCEVRCRQCVRDVEVHTCV